MPRSRMIKPEFWDDEKISTISRDARLLFVGLWNYSDDYGVVRGNHRWLMNKIFPYDTLSLGQFSKWMVELEKIDRIRHFEVDTETYYFIPKFTEHQIINRPSKSRNPAPPDTLTEYSLSTHGILTDEIEIESKREINISAHTKNLHEPSVFFSSKFFDVDIDHIGQLRADYPGLSEDQLKGELKKAADWCEDNPQKFKRRANGKRANVKTFLRNWLNRVVLPRGYGEPPKTLDFCELHPDRKAVLKISGKRMCSECKQAHYAQQGGGP